MKKKLDSKATSVTKSVRNFNPNPMNGLDSSGDNLSVKYNPNNLSNTSGFMSTPKTSNNSNSKSGVFFPEKQMPKDYFGLKPSDFFGTSLNSSRKPQSNESAITSYIYLPILNLYRV